MTPEAQREAIARACGWRSTIESWYSPEGSAHARSVYRRNADELIDDSHILPDYLTDLNAMRDAENTLTSGQRRYYAECLIQVHPLRYDPTIRVKDENLNDNYMKLFLIANMSAAQRAEAFIKAKGLWVDERKPYEPYKAPIVAKQHNLGFKYWDQSKSDDKPARSVKSS